MGRKIYSAITTEYRVEADATDSTLLHHAATIRWYSREGDSPENHIPTGVMLNIQGIPHRYALVPEDSARYVTGDSLPPESGYHWKREGEPSPNA